MKINEITEGFLKYLGAAGADAIGAQQTASALRKSVWKEIPDEPLFFTKTDKVQKVLSLLTSMQNAKNQRLTRDQIRSIISSKLPSAWAVEKNKAGVLDSFFNALQKAPLAGNPTIPGKPSKPNAPAQTTATTMRIGDDEIDPESPLGKQLAARMAGK